MRRWGGGDLHSATSGNWALSRLVGWFGLLAGWLADFVFTSPGERVEEVVTTTRVLELTSHVWTFLPSSLPPPLLNQNKKKATNTDNR